jgi:hypothetical protein
MKKITTLVLMLCLTLSGALYPAYGTAGTEKEKGEGTPTIIIIKSQHGGTDKSGSIVPSIEGHTLTVVFSENLGQVTIEVSTVSGTSVHFTSTPTPNGVQCYIPNTGDYIVTFTLTNGDEYYGEFTVTD